MKKYMLIIMAIMVLATGCDKKQDDVKITSSTTTTATTTELVTEPTTESTTTTTVLPTTKKTSTTITAKKTTTKKSTTTKATPTPTTARKLTEQEVYNAMITLKSQYPDGTPWNNDNKYVWKASNRKNYTGRGCAGFAFMLTDAAFGNAPATKHTDFTNIRVGDIIRQYGDSHSVVVLKVNANSYTVAEGNMNGTVYWGREVSKEEAQTMSTYIYTRW